MEETNIFASEKIGKIMRRSIYTFFQYYEHFTTTPLFLIIPFSASILLSHALFATCFNSIFRAIGVVSQSSKFLSQTIFTSIFTFPFEITSLVIAKAKIIQILIHPKSNHPLPFSCFEPILKPMLLTQLCNSILIIALKTISVSLLFAIYTSHSLKKIGFSLNNPFVLLVVKSVCYIFLANTSVICNLALVVAGIENCVGHMPIIKAFMLSWNRNSFIFSMNFLLKLSVVAVEGLFGYRVIRDYHVSRRSGLSLAFEGLLIAYLYSLLIVLDTVANCLFLQELQDKFPDRL